MYAAQGNLGFWGGLQAPGGLNPFPVCHKVVFGPIVPKVRRGDDRRGYAATPSAIQNNRIRTDYREQRSRRILQPVWGEGRAGGKDPTWAPGSPGKVGGGTSATGFLGCVPAVVAEAQRFLLVTSCNKNATRALPIESGGDHF